MRPIINAALNARPFMYIVRGKFHVFSFSGIKNVLNSLDLRLMLTHVNKNTPCRHPLRELSSLHEYFVKQFIKEQNPSGKSHEITSMEQGRASAWNAISITGSACREALLKLL
jgi:hypothetical protein